MGVTCSAVAAIKKGMSVRGAAKKFGIARSTLCDHLTILNGTNPVDDQQKENLLQCAIEAVTSGRCSASRAARAYGVPERTVRCRLKNPRSRLGRKSLLSEAEEETLTQILIRLGKLNCGLTKHAHHLMW